VIFELKLKGGVSKTPHRENSVAETEPKGNWRIRGAEKGRVLEGREWVHAPQWWEGKAL
jgi:hypothetical protein